MGLGSGATAKLIQLIHSYICVSGTLHRQGYTKGTYPCFHQTRSLRENEQEFTDLFCVDPSAAAKNFCSVPSLECDFPLGLSVIQFSLYSHEDISTKKHFTGEVKQYDEPIGCLKHLSLFSSTTIMERNLS